MYDPRLGPCQGCENRFPPYQGEDGKMHTCRHGCPRWEAHEAGKEEAYGARIRSYAANAGVSPGHEAIIRKRVNQAKQGGKRIK